MAEIPYWDPAGAAAADLPPDEPLAVAEQDEPQAISVD